MPHAFADTVSRSRMAAIAESSVEKLFDQSRVDCVEGNQSRHGPRR